MSLNDKQKRFVAEYLIDLNATQAAIRAGYSEKTAAVIGHENLIKPKIATAIQAAMEKRAKRLEITADSVLQEIAKIAFMDPRKFFNSDGSTKQVTELDDDTAMGLAGMEVIELFEGQGEQKHVYGLLKKFRLADKGLNLERLGKHLKLFTDKAEITGQVTYARVVVDL
jgi:phage terminase small subunit